MDEETIQIFSKALTHLCFRNGIVEDLHAEGSKLTNETMKVLNKDINNRIYTVLSLWFGSESDHVILSKMLELSAMYGSSWDKAEIPNDLVALISVLKEDIE